MNDQKIYELLAKTPDIRAVQIADALDQELTDVSDALKALVDEGDVVRHAGTAPNGQPAQIYNLSQTFMRSAEYKAIKAQLDAAPAPAVTSTAKVAESVPAVHAAAPKVSRIDDAIAFIRLMGKVTTAELKQHMGLGSGASPASWLNTAIQDGRLVRNGNHWTIGKGKPVASESAQKSPAAAAPETAAAAVIPPTASTPTSPAFRCGLWSDNVLDLQRDGVTLTTLTRTEGEHMASFFNRMLATTESA